MISRRSSQGRILKKHSRIPVSCTKTYLMPISVIEKRTYDVYKKSRSVLSHTWAKSPLRPHFHCTCIALLLLLFFILSCYYPSLKIVTVGWLQLADPSTKPWVVSAIGKVTSQMGQLLESTREVLEKHLSGVDVELRQVRK